MPTKPLPAAPSLAHLKAQAKDLVRAHRANAADANQRIREFHPRFRERSDAEIFAAPFQLSDAQLSIAREYGFSSWTRLKAHVEDPSREDLDAPKHERIKDPSFRKAVALIDAGDAEGLRELLRAEPALTARRVSLEGANYFTHPSLLEFVAENPARNGTLPGNIASIAAIILDAGAKNDRAAMDSTLGLVASSSVAHQCGTQLALIRLLCASGADPGAAVLPALIYGEFDAVHELLRLGAELTLPVAAATGNRSAATRLATSAGKQTRQVALGLAAQFGHTQIVELLLDAGADPDSYCPPGTHSHTTPLHQAALAGHDRTVRLLVERGARSDIKDIFYQSTAEGWAQYAGHTAIADYLRGIAPEAKKAR